MLFQQLIARLVEFGAQRFSREIVESANRFQCFSESTTGIRKRRAKTLLAADDMVISHFDNGLAAS